MTWEELIDRGIQAARDIDHNRWQLGALAATVEMNYGQNALGKWAAAINVSVRRVQDYRTVYRFWPDSVLLTLLDELPNLSWSHYRMAAHRADKLAEATGLEPIVAATQAVCKASDDDLTIEQHFDEYLRGICGLPPVDNPIAELSGQLVDDEYGMLILAGDDDEAVSKLYQCVPDGSRIRVRIYLEGNTEDV